MKSYIISRIVNFLTRGNIKYGWWTSCYRSSERPIILGGASRSGTTLLRTILNSHSNIFIGPETALFTGNRKLCHLSRVTGMYPRRLQEHYLRSACLAEFAENVLMEMMHDAHKRWWGEKTPVNVRHLPNILRFFPDARFIHIIRDGRDVVCSLRTHPQFRWENGKRVPTGIVNPWDKCVAEWENDVHAGLHWRDDPRYFEIRYESLVECPEPTLRPLFTWLGEAWEPQVLENYKTDESPTHPGLTDSINTNAVGRWQHDLPGEARREFRKSAEFLLRDLGYCIDDSWLDASQAVSK